MAAMHAGKLTDKGGDIEVLVGGEVTGLKGSLKNGITSEDKGEYVRSFTVVGKEYS
jgi:hypothetical protein